MLSHLQWLIENYMLMTIIQALPNFNWVERTQIARFMRPTGGPPVSGQPQMGPILAAWTLLWGKYLQCWHTKVAYLMPYGIHPSSDESVGHISSSDMILITLILLGNVAGNLTPWHTWWGKDRANWFLLALFIAKMYLVLEQAEIVLGWLLPYNFSWDNVHWKKNNLNG